MIGTFISNYFRRITENDVINSVVRDTVLYVEQVYKDTKGKDKLKKALERASLILMSKGIEITREELETTIESIVNEFQKLFEENMIQSGEINI